MIYIECPNLIPFRKQTRKSLFLGGGITGCPDWQQDMRHMLAHTELVIINPRRDNFPIGDPEASVAQIKWEFVHLAVAKARMFWFPRESVCPIALFELGKWIGTTTSPLFVGCDPGYPRAVDILIQMQLERPKVVLRYTLDAMAQEIAEWSQS